MKIVCVQYIVFGGRDGMSYTEVDFLLFGGLMLSHRFGCLALMEG